MVKQGYCGIGKGVDSPWETGNSGPVAHELTSRAGQPRAMAHWGGARGVAALNQMNVLC